MPDAHIVDVVKFMPGRIVAASPVGEGDSLAGSDFFHGVAQRRFASPEYSSAELGIHALSKLLRRNGIAADNVDLILYSCVFNDTFWPGIGPAVQAGVGARNAMVMQVDTSCCSWLSALRVAEAFIGTGQCRNVVVLTVTNFISRLPEFQRSSGSRVLGDGASAALLAPGERSILASFERSHGEHSGLLNFDPDLVDGVFHDFWERGCGPISVRFTEESVRAIRENATALVPEAVEISLKRAGMIPDDVSLLITHQPNSKLLDDWRQACGITGTRTHDTLAKYGNLFHGSIPVTLADALEEGRIRTGDVLALGTFANGGDMVSAMTLRWTAPVRAPAITQRVDGASDAEHYERLHAVTKPTGTAPFLKPGTTMRPSSVSTPPSRGDLAAISGLIRRENTSQEECLALMQKLTKPVYQHAEIFDEYCSLGQYIDVPFDVLVDYAADVHSLEEWTYSVRDLRHVGGGLYRGQEAIQPDTKIFIRADVQRGPDLATVVYPCAWDQGHDLWMRYYFTFIDALRTLRRPGTVALWTNCKHPYYDRDVTDVPQYITEGRSRTDRYWVGDIWPNFDAIHRIEIRNMKRIAEARFISGTEYSCREPHATR
ncbi:MULTISPECIES: 3-oxoacyl-ACP synthase III family protein [Streptomyces]|nr:MULTISPECIES: 3-oxoacyl-[acyl-carrier-protein] synthase III C-terminal domain-containing protein [Streptomyces]